MYSAYAVLSSVIASPITLEVMAGVALLEVRTLIALDERLKRKKLH